MRLASPEVTMNASQELHIARKEGDARSDVHTDAVMLFCVGVVAICFAAPLLLTLPQTLDAAERPVSAWVGPAPDETSQAPFHERYSMQPTSDWADSLDEGELAAWRQRASD
jgi:hypothetical protein